MKESSGCIVSGNCDSRSVACSEEGCEFGGCDSAGKCCSGLISGGETSLDKKAIAVTKRSLRIMPVPITIFVCV